MDDLQRHAVEHRAARPAALPGRGRARASGRQRACRRARAASPSVPAPPGGRTRHRRPAPPPPGRRAAARGRAAAPARTRARANAEAPFWKAAAATASAGIHAASGCSASTPAPRAVRSATSRSPCRVATSVSDGSTNVTSPSAGRYQAASTRCRFARRTASTDAAWCEKTVHPRTLACAIPARSSAFVSA